MSLVLGLLGMLIAMPAAWGHASLVGSEPVDRAVVAQSPTEIRLIFNEPVSPIAVRLIGPDGQPSALTDVSAVDRTLTARIPAVLPRGTHLLSWRVISADGHPVGGTITFSVVEPSAETPLRPQFEPDRKLQLAIWLAKVVLYAGLLFGVGGVFYLAWIARTPSPGTAQTIVVAIMLCGLIAAVMSIGLQGADVMELPLSELRKTQLWAAGFATSYGAAASIAAAALVLALVALRAKSHNRIPAALALGCVGAALAASGHAASAAPELLMRPAVFLHGVSVAFWVGALIPLMAAIRAAEPRIAELARFSRAVPLAVAVLAATGLGLSVVQLGSFDMLWTTSYGAVLSGKLAAVLALLALGGWNRYVLTPRIVSGASGAARPALASEASSQRGHSKAAAPASEASSQRGHSKAAAPGRRGALLHDAARPALASEASSQRGHSKAAAPGRRGALLHDAARRLAGSIRLEVAIVAIILGLVALWRFTPPPRSYLAALGAPVQLHIHTANAMADVRFEPPRAGGRTVIVAIWDGNFAPLAAKAVTVVLAKPDAGIEPLRMAAVHVADSSWRVDGLTLPVAGRWRVRVEILVDDFEKRTIDDEVELH